MLVAEGAKLRDVWARPGCYFLWPCWERSFGGGKGEHTLEEVALCFPLPLKGACLDQPRRPCPPFLSLSRVGSWQHMQLSPNTCTFCDLPCKRGGSTIYCWTSYPKSSIVLTTLTWLIGHGWPSQIHCVNCDHWRLQQTRSWLRFLHKGVTEQES